METKKTMVKESLNKQQRANNKKRAHKDQIPAQVETQDQAQAQMPNPMMDRKPINLTPT